MTNLDIQMQQAEADIADALQRISKNITTYSDFYFRLEFTPQNSEHVNTYLNGLDTLSEALRSITEAAKCIAQAKGISLENVNPF